MKIKCPECKREFEVRDESIMCVCKCGETIELKGGDKSGKI